MFLFSLFQIACVSDLKSRVSERLAIPADTQYHLACGRHILEDGKLLSSYPTLGNGSTLFLLVPLLGGAEGNGPPATNLNRGGNPAVDPALLRSDERCMVTHENFEEDGTLVLTMPCGHPMSPGALMDYTWSEINAGKIMILCLQCTNEWGAEVIKRYGGISDQEFRSLEEGLSKNACIADDAIKKCSRCKSFCTRINKDNPRVVCHVCSKNLDRPYHFCWYCLREWNRNSGIKSCGYEDCKDEEKLRQLMNSEIITIQEIPKRTMYKLRACPHCGKIIRCRNPAEWRTQCRKCGTEFCFNCLRAKVQDSWFCSSDVGKVICNLAPIQKKIPRLHREVGQQQGQQGNVQQGSNGQQGGQQSGDGSYCHIL